MKNVIMVVAVLMVGVGVGCTALSHLVTPAEKSEKAVAYVGEPNLFTGYFNLSKAILLESAVEDTHEVNQLRLLQLAESDNLTYTQLNDVVSGNRVNAQKSEEMLFGDKGFLSLGLTSLGFGALTGVLGLMRKRPQDITPDELNKAISGKDAELTEKQKQMIEVVKGVQEFLDLNKNTQLGKKLRAILDKNESAETKKAVAIIRAS